MYNLYKAFHRKDDSFPLETVVKEKKCGEGKLKF